MLSDGESDLPLLQVPRKPREGLPQSEGSEGSKHGAFCGRTKAHKPCKPWITSRLSVRLAARGSDTQGDHCGFMSFLRSCRNVLYECRAQRVFDLESLPL